jgi:hypothetical protein
VFHKRKKICGGTTNQIEVEKRFKTGELFAKYDEIYQIREENSSMGTKLCRSGRDYY